MSSGAGAAKQRRSSALNQLKQTQHANTVYSISIGPEQLELELEWFGLYRTDAGSVKNGKISVGSVPIQIH